MLLSRAVWPLAVARISHSLVWNFQVSLCFVIREIREPHYPTVQCFCADELIEGAVIASESDCDMGCGGNATLVMIFHATRMFLTMIYLSL